MFCAPLEAAGENPDVFLFAVSVAKRVVKCNSFTSEFDITATSADAIEHPMSLTCKKASRRNSCSKDKTSSQGGGGRTASPNPRETRIFISSVATFRPNTKSTNFSQMRGSSPSSQDRLVHRAAMKSQALASTRMRRRYSSGFRGRGTLLSLRVTRKRPCKSKLSPMQSLFRPHQKTLGSM